MLTFASVSRWFVAAYFGWWAAWLGAWAFGWWAKSILVLCVVEVGGLIGIWRFAWYLGVLLCIALGVSVSDWRFQLINGIVLIWFFVPAVRPRQIANLLQRLRGAPAVQ